MGVSFVTIALNEEKRIDFFLKSLSNQTKRPDEIVFVDNGSTDKTLEKVKKSKLKIIVFVKKGVNLATLRNFGISKAKNDIIAMVDSDCVLHPEWLERITTSFADKTVDIVSGFYVKKADSILQRCLNPYFGVSPDKIDKKNFLPATCSIAFTKKIWQKIGGFNEKLDKAGEDSLFNYEAKLLGARFITRKDALVDWEVPQTIKRAINKFYNYAKGDSQTGIWWNPTQKFSTHNLKTISIFGRYFILVSIFLLSFHFQPLWFLLLTLFFGYLFWSIAKNFNQVKDYRAVYYLPLIQIISDFCVMLGFVVGFFKKA